jgi:hypothetical protein
MYDATKIIKASCFLVAIAMSWASLGCSSVSNGLDRRILAAEQSAFHLRDLLGPPALIRDGQVAPGNIQTTEYVYFLLDSKNKVQARLFNYKKTDGTYMTSFFLNYDFSQDSHLTRVLDPRDLSDKKLITEAALNIK